MLWSKEHRHLVNLRSRDVPGQVARICGLHGAGESQSIENENEIYPDQCERYVPGRTFLVKLN